MDLTLTAETRKRLEAKLQSGHYGSTEDVVRAALNALDEIELTELDEDTHAAIERAETDIEQGRVHEWKDVRESIRAKFLGSR